MKKGKDTLQEWLCEHQAEFEKKYPGMFLAIVDNKVVFVARDLVTADKEAEKKCPGKPSLATYIPKSKEEVQFFVGTN